MISIRISDKIRDVFRPYTHHRAILKSIRWMEACKYMNRDVWDKKRGNREILRAINSGRAHAIGKIGSAELFAIRKYLRYSGFPDADDRTALDRKILGLYPDSLVSLRKYVELMIDETLPEMTILSVWFNLGEHRIVNKYGKRAKLMPMDSLETYAFKDIEPKWTSALKGKSILVISPFVQSIQCQYQAREKIWPGREDILPEFELNLIKAPFHLSLSPQKSPDWFETLDEMKAQMSTLRFDVALIGASVFSLPLVVHAKRMGKIGIHLGGAHQIYFGITGKRWEKNKIIAPLVNEHWQHPFPEETPIKKNVIEGGAYW